MVRRTSPFEERTKQEYFDWMINLVGGNRYAGRVTFVHLLESLHDTEFVYTIHRDKNRYEDGISLRYRFGCDNNCEEDAERYLTGPCSVLEMMVALALRCEETIMDDPSIGNRTAQWFWSMVTNLGLGSMYDSRFDKRIFDMHMYKFINHKYDRDGKGGLFTVRNCKYDMRDEEIWNQLNWYLDGIN